MIMFDAFYSITHVGTTYGGVPLNKYNIHICSKYGICFTLVRADVMRGLHPNRIFYLGFVFPAMDVGIRLFKQRG